MPISYLEIWQYMKLSVKPFAKPVKALRRGWCFGSEEFRQRLLELPAVLRNSKHSGGRIQQSHDEKEALYFIDGDGLLPAGLSGAYVDGIHPTSHGFALIAERLAPQLRAIRLRINALEL